MQSIFRNNFHAKSPPSPYYLLERCQILRSTFPPRLHVQGRSQCRPKFITDVPQNSRKPAGWYTIHLGEISASCINVNASNILQVRGLTDNNNLNYPSELDKHRDADISSPTGRTPYGGNIGLGMRGERESRDRGRGDLRDDLHSHRSSSSLSERGSAAAAAAAAAAAVAAASGNASLQSAAAALGLTGGERSPSVGSASAAAAAVAAAVAAAANRSASADVLNSRGDAGSDRGSERGNDNSACVASGASSIDRADRVGVEERRDDLVQLDYSSQSKRDRDREVSTTPEHIISNKRRRKNSSNCDNLLTSTQNANVQDRHYTQDSQVC